MSNLLSNVRRLFSSDTEEHIDDEFIYFWDDIPEEEYIEVERHTSAEFFTEKLLAITHLLILGLALTLFLGSLISNIFIQGGIFLALAGMIAISYFLIHGKYQKPLVVGERNAKLIKDLDLSASDELLFMRESSKLLEYLDDFRINLVDTVKSQEVHSRNLRQSFTSLDNKLSTIQSELDSIQLQIDNNVANVANYQEASAMLNHVSTGIDDFTLTFDEALTIIDEISNIVRSIGKQTSMLALNAGIEAARAGEMGKGFEVLASNLRRLSQHATSSSNRIKDKTKNINKNAKNSLEQITSSMTQLRINFDKKHDNISNYNSGLYQLVQDFENLNSYQLRVYQELDETDSILDKYEI